MTPSQPPDRYAPDIAFPAYAYVPGQQPHPVRDPQGHSFGKVEEVVPCPDPLELERVHLFRFAVDLFNHGYYWEAHEAWEVLWHAFGRTGAVADFLKGLIHLAAAGVKAREGRLNGVERHAERAKVLFDKTGHTRLVKTAMDLASQPRIDSTPTSQGKPVLGIRLDLEMLTVR
jgi:uncharacterized protein